MVPILPADNWAKWWASKQLPVSAVRFALESCYYGFGIRSRPGTLVVTDTELIHHSYSWRDTWWAIFEPSVRVSIPLNSVLEVRRLRMSLGLRLLQCNPDSAFRILSDDGKAHGIVLQRGGDDFADVLGSLGVAILDETHA